MFQWSGVKPTCGVVIRSVCGPPLLVTSRCMIDKVGTVTVNQEVSALKFLLFLLEAAPSRRWILWGRLPIVVGSG